MHPKTTAGNFFEDFRLGQMIRHATPRTVTVGDVSLYTALYGIALRGAVVGRLRRRPSAIRSSPVDDLLVFHIVFGKTVPDVSLNAIANLGYAGGRFLQAGLSRRHAARGVRGDRAEGELQPQDRRGLCPLDRLQPARRGGARLCALGDGAQARRERAGAPSSTCPTLPKARGARRARHRLPAHRHRRAGTRRWPAAPLPLRRL